MVEREAEFDVIIAGGGPAGLSALLWCSKLGLNSILLEKEKECGGQLFHIFNSIRDYMGVETANGSELCDAFMRQMKDLDLHVNAKIIKADLSQKRITLADGRVYSGRAIIIATGVRRRKLDVPGEDEFWNRGILQSGIKARNEVAGKTVLIVGGGDAAMENATILSETANKVVVVHRREQFTARDALVAQAKDAKNVEFVLSAKVSAINGRHGVESVEIEHLMTGMLSHIETDAVLIRVGVEPNTELFRGQIDMDDDGYVLIGATCATNASGVFAGGDAANPIAPTIAAAVGHGAIAAKSIFNAYNRRKRQ